ncbi:hypothetical protein scyTo_0017829, partial [Scyliorhinus torazame]|nr:hypothetical protein [Scyliorhinus torazame]
MRGMLSNQLGLLPNQLGDVQSALGVLSKELGMLSNQLRVLSNQLGVLPNQLGVLPNQLRVISNQPGLMSNQLRVLSNQLEYLHLPSYPLLWAPEYLDLCQIMILHERNTMNAQFIRHPVTQQLPSIWSNLDLGSDGGYSGSSWHHIHPQLWTKYQVWEWLQHTLDINQLDANCVRFQDFDVTGEQLCSMTIEHFTQTTGHLGPLLFDNLRSFKQNSKHLSSNGQPLMAEQRGTFINSMLFPVNVMVKSQAL